MSLSDDGQRASRNMAHMVVDQHFLTLPVPMVPVGGARVQSIADPVGDTPVRLSAIFWSEQRLPAAVVVLVGHDASLPDGFGDAWFDSQVSAVIGEEGAAFVADGYDRVVALVDEVEFSDIRFVSVSNGAAVGSWQPSEGVS